MERPNATRQGNSFFLPWFWPCIIAEVAIAAIVITVMCAIRNADAPKNRPNPAPAQTDSQQSVPQSESVPEIFPVEFEQASCNP